MSISSQQTDTLTFESWQALSETKQRYEIVDGEMIVPPGPSVDHQWISRKIDRRLEDFVEAQGLGIVLAAPLDLLVRREPLRVRQPDILYLNGDRTGLRSRRDIRGMQTLDIAPDIAIEVLSPSNTRRDIQDKLEDYRQMGTLECWLASPEAETVEVVELSPEGMVTVKVFGSNETLISARLEGFALPLQEIFE
jgi:Uma2 family endonuclease